MNYRSVLFVLIIATALQGSVANAAPKFRRPFGQSVTVLNFMDHDSSASCKTYDCRTGCATGVGKSYGDHGGTDFDLAVDSALYAGANGVFESRYDGCSNTGTLSSTCGGGFGNNVRMKHPDIYSIYGHMKNGTPINVANGTIINCCQEIGRSASSGRSNWPHVHFELRTAPTSATTSIDPYSGTCSQSTSYWVSVTGTAPATTCASPPAETCNGVDDNQNTIIDDLESCWTPVYRFWDTSMASTARSRCYGTSSSPPSLCSGYALEFSGPAFYVYRNSGIPGTVELIAFDKNQDHILTRGDESGDIAALTQAGYTRRGTLGYIWSSTSTAPTGTFFKPSGANTSSVRNLRRFSKNPPGIHLFPNNPAETAPSGWSNEGVRGFVFSSRW